MQNQYARKGFPQRHKDHKVDIEFTLRKLQGYSLKLCRIIFRHYVTMFPNFNFFYQYAVATRLPIKSLLKTKIELDR